MAQKKSPFSVFLPPISSYMYFLVVLSSRSYDDVSDDHTPIDDVSQYSCPEQLYSTAVFYHGQHGYARTRMAVVGRLLTGGGP